LDICINVRSSFLGLLFISHLIVFLTISLDNMQAVVDHLMWFISFEWVGQDLSQILKCSNTHILQGDEEDEEQK